MKLRIEPAFIAVIGLSILCSIGTLGLLVDQRDTAIVHRLADRNFEVVSRAAVDHLNSMAQTAGDAFSRPSGTVVADAAGVVPISLPPAPDARLKSLQAGLSRLVGPDEQVVVFSRSGDVLLATGDTANPGLLPAARQAVRLSLPLMDTPGSDRSRLLDVRGEDRQGYRVSVRQVGDEIGFPWLMAVVAPHSALFAEARKLHIDLLCWGSILLLAGLAFSYVFARAFTRPIRLIDEEARRIAEFDIDSGRQLPDSRIFEIADLSRTITSMRQGISGFGRFVPQVLVRDLVASGSEPAIGGERRELTVMFSDIADFSRLSERTDAKDLMARLSEYLAVLAGEVHRHDGTVDKYIGDSLMAFWNAPERNDDHANRAADAVLAARRAALDLNREFVARGLPVLHTRFGLHLGDAVVGFIGGGDRLQYTAVGETVNLASRTEGLNKFYGTDILITGALQQRLAPRFATRLLGRARPAGLSTSSSFYELMGYGEDGTIGQQASLWQAAIQPYFQRDFATATEAFSEYLLLWPQDRLARHYQEKSLLFARCGPPPGWDGIDRQQDK